MNYWLHRITGGDNAIPLSEELFKKGYISIGWSDFSDEADLNTIRSGWTPFETLFANWNPIPRNRYNLWRFVNEMKPFLKSSSERGMALSPPVILCNQ